MRKCGVVLVLLWTLWTRTETPTSDSWTPAPGFGSEEKCRASMKEKLDLWKQFKDAKFGSDSVTFTSNNTTMSYLCLPETEDPRRDAKTPKPQK